MRPERWANDLLACRTASVKTRGPPEIQICAQPDFTDTFYLVVLSQNGGGFLE